MKEYFSHDYNARNDQKIVSLRRKYGVEGVGIYWCLVEIMYECYGSIHEDKIDDIAFDLRVDINKVKFILDSELFKKKSKKYFSTSILNRLEQRKEKSEKARANSLKRWDSKNKGNAPALLTESERNAIKVNNIKVKKSKEDIKSNIKPTNKQEQIELSEETKFNHSSKVFFDNSSLGEIKLFRKFLEDEGLGEVDADYYFYQIRNHSDSKDVKRNTRGWKGAIRTWITKSKEWNKLKMKTKSDEMDEDMKRYLNV